LEKKREFRNPHLYAKFVEYLCLEESGSNFSLQVFDPVKLAEKDYQKLCTYVLIGWLAKLPDNELGELYAELDGKKQAAMMNRSQVDFVTSRIQATQRDDLAKKTGAIGMANY
jgi:hypothetical protein